MNYSPEATSTVVLVRHVDDNPMFQQLLGILHFNLSRKQLVLLDKEMEFPMSNADSFDPTRPRMEFAGCCNGVGFAIFRGDDMRWYSITLLDVEEGECERVPMAPGSGEAAYALVCWARENGRL